MLVSRPEIFCWILDGRRSCSAWFEVGGTLRSWAERSTSSGRSRRTCSSSRALCSPGRLLWLVVSDNPTSIPLRSRRSSSSRTSPGMAVRPPCASEAGFVGHLAWGIGDLDRPHRVGVDRRGVVEVSQQMRGAQLVDQGAERGGVVVLVPVVHDHRAGQLGHDEGRGRGQGAIVEQVVGVELGARDQQVALGLLLPRRRGLGADPEWVSSQHTA